MEENVQGLCFFFERVDRREGYAVEGENRNVMGCYDFGPGRGGGVIRNMRGADGTE